MFSSENSIQMDQADQVVIVYSTGWRRTQFHENLAHEKQFPNRQVGLMHYKYNTVCINIPSVVRRQV